MSERERWIVYPLLFFALGAAVRDKILHRVDTTDITCESLRIVDPHDPTGQTFAELTIHRSWRDDPTGEVDRVGMLRLADSQGQDVCQLQYGAILPRVISGRLDIIDSNRQVRAVLTTEPGPQLALPNGRQANSTQGVLGLTNPWHSVRMSPPGNRNANPEPPQPDTL